MQLSGAFVFEVLELIEKYNFFCYKSLCKLSQNAHYGLYSRDYTIKFRTAKTTPANETICNTLERLGNGPILPYDMDDSIDLFFQSLYCREYDVISMKGEGGKRALFVFIRHGKHH